MICRAVKWVGGKLADVLFGPEGELYVSRTTLEGVRIMTVEEIVRSQVRPGDGSSLAEEMDDLRGTRLAEWKCALDSEWCDGVVCVERGIRCPRASRVRGE
jgi:hypothetical protein